MMAQPFIKFAGYCMSYITFIVLILASSFEFKLNVINDDEKFSTNYRSYYSDYVKYTQRSNLTIKFEVNDFYIRANHMPSILDIIICSFLIGKCLMHYSDLVC